MRAGLKYATITLFKYKPLVGVIEKDDPRNFITYYEYDSSNRLKRTYIKDANSNVQNVESYEYKYR